MMMIIIITLTRSSAAKKHDAKDEKPATRLDCKKKKTQELELKTSKNGNNKPELAYEDEAYVM
jgi:hypothetical protein